MVPDRRWQGRWLDLGWTTILTIAALGPVLYRRGFSLRGDMVFVPNQPWSRGWLGLDGSVPRSVPMDAVVWLLNQIAPGDVVQKLLLAGALLVAGLGIGRLLRTLSPLARAAAITCYLWNPWVYERLAIGQWACVAGYALLPWLAICAASWRERGPRGWSTTAMLLILASLCAPSMALVALVVTGAVLLTRPNAQRLSALLATALVACLPWLVPALLRPQIEATPGQFADFAARAESSAGLPASLLSLGGIWKSTVVPPERQSAFIVACSLLLTALAVVGLRRATTHLGGRTILGLVLGGTASFALAVGPAFGPVAELLGRLSHAVPAVGILRDSDRYLAPFALLLVVGVAAGVESLEAAAQRDRAALLAAAGLAALFPVLLLPSLAGGLRGGLEPAHYPADWNRVAQVVRGTAGCTVVLPWTGGYRRYDWNDRRAVLDPAPRFLPGSVLVDDRMFLGRSVVASEDPYLARIGRALAGPDPADRLRALGVRWVLLEKGNGATTAQLPPGTVAVDGQWLKLVDLGTPAPSPRRHPRTSLVIAADAATLLMLLGALAISCRRRPSCPPPVDLQDRRIVVANWRDLEHSRAGGAERYAWEVARALTDAGARVTFLTAREARRPRSEQRDGIRIERRGGPLTFYPRALAFLLWRRTRIDAVVDADCGIPVFSPLVLPRRTAVLLVVHHVHHDQFGVHLPRPVASLGRWLEGTAMPRIYRRATAVAVSPSTEAEMRGRLRWEGPIGLLLNGNSTPVPATPGGDADRIIVLGRLVAHKRVDAIVAAIAELRATRPDLRVDVIGSGPELDRVGRLVQRLSLDQTVALHGFVDEATKARLLRGAQLHVCASDAEGWGQVVIEAASYGVPTVARDVPGLRDSVVPGRTGWLIDERSADESSTLADRLRRGIDGALEELADDARRRDLGAACREWADQFTWQRMHAATVEHVVATLRRAEADSSLRSGGPPTA